MKQDKHTPTENLRLIRWANEGFPPIDLSGEADSILALIREYKSLKALCSEMLEAMQGVLNSWMRGTQGQIKSKATTMDEIVGAHSYWVPSAAMVQSEFMNALRLSVEKANNILNPSKTEDNGKNV